ncbi:MAG: glycogen-binding domain-containing protein, partial [Elusimicrobia bacterium]|nr:glycogen-binding domain-containing protein [Elusimicrobiota bacterium]
AAVLALVSVPSYTWVSALNDYRRFLSGWEPAPLKNTGTTFTPHEDGGESLPTLTSVEFRHRAPKAKSVELVGDFNAWRTGLLRMTRGGDGVWTVSIPVVEGRHKYLFLVDGEPKVDARAQTTDGPQGRRVSVRIVK